MIQLLFTAVFFTTVSPILFRLCLRAEESEARLVKFGLAGRLIPVIFLSLIAIVKLKWLEGLSLLNVFRLVDNAVFTYVIEVPMHEMGHFAFSPLGPTMMTLGGSLMEVLLPAGMFAYFIWRGCPRLASFMLFFVGRHLIYVAWYMSTARHQEGIHLSLEQDPANHDWLKLFTSWGLLEQDTAIGAVTRFGGIALMFIALVFMLILSETPKENNKDALPPEPENNTQI